METIMMNYIIYTSEYGDCIVEVLNLNDQDLLQVETSLIKQQYIITEVDGRYIKCHKIGSGSEE